MKGSKFYGKKKKNLSDIVDDVVDNVVEGFNVGASLIEDMRGIPGVHRAVNIFKDSTGKRPVFMKATLLYDPNTHECMVESIEPISDMGAVALQNVIDELSMKLVRNKEEMK